MLWAKYKVRFFFCCYVAQADLNTWIFLAWPPIPWDYRCEVQHLACMYLCTIQCTMNLL